MSAKNLKVFGPPATKWRPCKIFAKLTGNHHLMANIFKFHEYQSFGLMKTHSMCKIWYANNIFSLLRWNKKYFSWLFKGLSVARNCPAPVTILNNKRELLFNFAKKKLGVAILWDIVTRIFSYHWILNLQNFLQ